MKLKMLAAAFALTLSGAVQAEAADWTVGANIGNVPWEFQDAQGNMVGFEIDLVNEVAKRLGKTVEFQNIPFNGLFPAVSSNRIQIAISSITITKKRLETYTFAQPYYDSDQSLSSRTDSGVNKLEDVAGKTIGVDTGSTGAMYTTEHQGELKIATISNYEGLSNAMLDLEAGRIDGYISDIPAVQYYIKDKPQFAVIARIPTGERYSMMFNKGWADAAAINDTLTALKKEGFIQGLHKKWFGADAPADSSTVAVADMPQ